MAVEVKEFQLWAKCDFPAKEAVIRVAPGASIADLKNVAARALEMKADAVSKYVWCSINYGTDIVHFGEKKDETVGSVVRDRGYVFLRAPVDLKPARKRRTKKDKDEKEIKGGEDNKFKGFNPKNALSKLKAAKGLKKNMAFEYIDIYAKEVFRTPDFLALPHELVLTFAKRNTLNIAEVDLFDSVFQWAKAEVKRNGTTETPDALKKVLGEILSEIRFPTMTTQDIAVKVNPTKMLESQQVLELFTYLGMVNAGNKDPKLGATLTRFKRDKRKGRQPPAWFKWDATKKHSNLVVSADGKTVTSSTTSYYQPIFGDTEITDGVWEFEITLTAFYTNSYSVNVGFVPASFTDYTRSQMIGYSSHIPGWAFACGHGQKYNNRMETYTRKCTQGETVRARVDLDSKTLEYFINGVSQGIAYRDIRGPLRPAMSLYGTNTVVLGFPQ